MNTKNNQALGSYEPLLMISQPLVKVLSTHIILLHGKRMNEVNYAET